MATATTTSPRARAPAPAPSKPTLLGGVRGLDATVSLRLHALFLPVPRLLLKALEVAGDGRIWLPVPISLLLLSASPANASGAASPLLAGLVAGLVLDLILVGLVKVVVRRPRPAYNAKDMYVAVAADHWSFPSGHSSRAFLVTSFLAGGGFHPREALFLWATATSASRVLLGRHYVLDVVAGACLGVFEAWLSNLLLGFMCGYIPAARLFVFTTGCSVLETSSIIARLFKSSLLVALHCIRPASVVRCHVYRCNAHNSFRCTHKQDDSDTLAVSLICSSYQTSANDVLYEECCSQARTPQELLKLK